MTAPVAESSAIDRLVYRSRAFGGAFRTAARLQQAVLERRAHDVTDASASSSCLVLAPHPDDETLGAGATIARKRAAGTAVRVVVVADGRHANPSAIIGEHELAELRHAEGLAACAVLGVADRDVRFLGHEDTTLEHHVPEVAEAIAEELAAWCPEEILVCSAIDGHPDHRALNSALRRALAGSPCHPRVREYPVWFWDAKAWLDRGVPAARKLLQLVGRPPAATLGLEVSAVRTGTFLELKRAAMDEHRSQMTNLTGEDSWPVMDPAFLAHFFRDVELFFTPRWNR